MTVDITSVYNVYTVTSDEAGGVYPITFPFIAPEYVKCYYAVGSAQTNLTYGTDYTVDVDASEVTVTGAMPAGAKFVAYRVTELTQEIDWVEGQAVYTPDIEQADDKAMHILQELAGQVDRSIKISREEESSGVTPEERWQEIDQARDDAIAAKNGAEQAQQAAENARDAAQIARDTAQNAQAQAEMQAQRAWEKVESITGFSVEAETLDPGEAATATYDAEAVKMFLGIPQGMPGQDGADGEQGPQGPPGPQGQAPYADVIACGGACGTWLSTIQAGAACTEF